MGPSLPYYTPPGYSPQNPYPTSHFSPKPHSPLTTLPTPPTFCHSRNKPQSYPARIKRFSPTTDPLQPPDVKKYHKYLQKSHSEPCAQAGPCVPYPPRAPCAMMCPRGAALISTLCQRSPAPVYPQSYLIPALTLPQSYPLLAFSRLSPPSLAPPHPPTPRL